MRRKEEEAEQLHAEIRQLRVEVLQRNQHSQKQEVDIENAHEEYRKTVDEVRSKTGVTMF